MQRSECQCPKVQLDDWRDREVALTGHAFLTAPTQLLLHVPRQLYRDVQALEARIQLEGYRPSGAPLVLHRDGWFSGEILILYGDVPLISASFLRRFVEHHRSEGAALSFVTFRPADPGGYGRVVRE